jgi:hypothetical protein
MQEATRNALVFLLTQAAVSNPELRSEADALAAELPHPEKTQHAEKKDSAEDPAPHQEPAPHPEPAEDADDTAHEHRNPLASSQSRRFRK